MAKTRVTLAALTTVIVLAVAILAFGQGLSMAATESTSAEWRLTVTGLVREPLNLSLGDLAAMPQSSEIAAIYCVDFPGVIVAQGNWTGVRLSYVLDQATVDDAAIKVAFKASDGYSTDLTLQQARQSDVILAYQKDGAALSETLRLVVPGYWGYKWIGQLTNIELVNHDFLGKWESSGYPDDAVATYSGDPILGRIFGRSPVPSVPPPSATPTPTMSEPTPSPTTTLMTLAPTETVSPTATPTPTLQPTQPPQTLPPSAQVSTQPSIPKTTEKTASDPTIVETATNTMLPFAAASSIGAVALISVVIIFWRKRKQHI